MTDAMVKTARKAAPNSNIVGWTSIDGPPAIQGEQDGDAAIPPLLKLVGKADSAGAKAIIIGCFDDTGLSEARSISIMSRYRHRPSGLSLRLAVWI